MFCVSSFSWENRLTGLFVQTMCLIDRHLQVFLAILYVYVCMYLYSYRVSIAAESVRCLTYILVVPSHRTFRQYQSGRRSAVWPSSLVRCSDRPYLYLLFLPWRMMSIYSNEGKGKMKTSSSKREQIDSDHRLSSSFSRTIIWRCYRREKKKRERTRTIWWRTTDARATKTKHKRGKRRLSLLITRRWCTTTTEHLFFLFCFSLPSSLSFFLSISFTFAVVDHSSIRDKEIEQHTTIIISRA